MKLSSSLLLWAVGSTNGFVTDRLVARTGSTELFARKAFITGNWKLNPQTKAEAVDLARGIAASITDDSPCDVGLFVPFPFIGTVKEIVGDKLLVGAQVGSRQNDSRRMLPLLASSHGTIHSEFFSIFA
jgi:hypothetical protein